MAKFKRVIGTRRRHLRAKRIPLRRRFAGRELRPLRDGIAQLPEPRQSVLGHPVAGQTWETLVIETLIAAAPEGTDASFYRTSAGAEIDLVLALPNRQLWAIEIKRSSAPKVEKGFHFASADLKPQKQFVVYAGNERFSLGKKIEAIGLAALAAELQSSGRSEAGR